MNFDQFLEAIQNIALLYFDKDYDRAHNTNLSQAGPSAKISAFYEILGCNNSQDYRAKLKSYIPDSKDNLKKYTNTKNVLDNWNKQKDSLKESGVSSSRIAGFR